jgi:DNA replication initiation complex subunit (GINS family)
MSDIIKITLETLYDILRNEKKREDLQKLENSFFIDVISYLKEKKTFLDAKDDNKDFFSNGEKEKLEYELRSIKRILKEIYEKREKKILDIALNRSRTGSEIIDTSSMLKEEKEFYNRVLNTLDSYRRGVLMNLFNAELPFIDAQEKDKVCFTAKEEQTEPQTKAEVKPEITSEPDPSKPSTFTKFEGSPPIAAEIDETEEDEQKEPVESKSEPEQQEESNQEEPAKEPEKPVLEKIKVKFTHPMPSFVWKDMKVYGPFKQDEEIDIFAEVAELLVRKGRAVKV